MRKRAVAVELMASCPSVGEETLAVVYTTFLACKFWEDVPFYIRTTSELTVLEKFFIECALAMEEFKATDIEEIATIPRRVVGQIARRLERAGCIRIVDNGLAYCVCRDRAQQVLTDGAISTERQTWRSFLFLPRIDEVTALDEGDASSFSRFTSPIQAPIPKEYQQNTRLDILQLRLQAGDIRNIPEHATRFDESDNGSVLGPACRAYPCWGKVTKKGDDVITDLELHGCRKGRRRSEPEQAESFSVQLTGMKTLVAVWTKAYDEFCSDLDPVLAGALKLPADLNTKTTRRGNCSLTMRINVRAARALQDNGHRLDKTEGLVLSISDELSLAMVLSFEPANESARRCFAVDDMVTWFLVGGVPTRSEIAKAVASICRDRDLPPAESKDLTVEVLCERLWQLGEFEPVYRLRNAMDFDYD